MTIALENQKFDAHCAGMWASPKRGTTIAFSDPFFYTSIELVVRVDDTRFDDNVQRINSPDVRVSVADEAIYTEIAKNDLPKATLVAKSGLTGVEQHYMDLAAGRVDVAFGKPSEIYAYARENPGKVRMIHRDKPIRIFANSIGVHIHEQALRDLLNTATRQMVDSGRVKALLEKYHAILGEEYFIAPPRVYGAN